MNLFKRAVYLIIAGILVIFSPLLRLLKIKVGVLTCERIGHLALDTDVFLRRLHGGEIDLSYRYLFFVNPKIVVNKQLMLMFSRVLTIIENRYIYSCIKHCSALLDKLKLFQSLPMLSLEYEERMRVPTSLFMTDAEVEIGKKQLELLGFDMRRDKLVCVFARDGAYLEQCGPKIDRSYHNYRDSDIDTYVPAIEYLIEQGYWVFRIGSHPKKRVAYQHAHFIDYPFSAMRSEFMDIFLIWSSYFVVGTPSGICDVALILDKPFLGVNYTPLGYSVTGRDCLYVPKKLMDNRSKKIKPFYELWSCCHNPLDLASGHVMAKKYNVTFIDNTSQDILAAVKEMLARVKSQWNPNDCEQALLKKYYEEFWVNNPIAAQVKTPIGLTWLQENRQLYFQDS